MINENTWIFLGNCEFVEEIHGWVKEDEEDDIWVCKRWLTKVKTDDGGGDEGEDVYDDGWVNIFLLEEMR